MIRQPPVRCNTCGSEVDDEKFDDDGIFDCPECGMVWEDEVNQK